MEGKNKKKKILVEKMATNIVASQPPNSYRLQRRPLVSKVVDRRNEDKQEMKTSLEMKTALKKRWPNITWRHYMWFHATPNTLGEIGLSSFKKKLN